MLKPLVFHLRFKSGIRQGTLAGDVNRQAGFIGGSTVWGGVGWASAQLNGPEITERLVRTCRLSSLLWKRDDCYYVPAPVFPVAGKGIDDRKKLKKVQWVPVDELNHFVAEKINSNLGDRFFTEETVVSAALDRVSKAAVPYYKRRLKVAEGVVGVLVAECPEDMVAAFKGAIRLLGDTGLGGERSTGWGVFDVEEVSAAETPFGDLLQKEGKRYMTLGAFLPKPEELNLLEKEREYTGYNLWRFRGYVGETDVIKPTVVCLSHGSLLPFKPVGKVIDITPSRMEHPVLFNGCPPSLAVDLPKLEEVEE
ncbi:CRISPR-associated protein, Csm4 family [Thermovirga lienii DSM 17291]|uniref:CRISPR system Cms protein Csm4 n=1 Tax=Thermovirga lienii (strain ATCC BAA-1197 / DSM 17291 / Cas60314) TaxID=580340 RepID=G7V6E9_THELD|nr:type III-A CRISPR-associated RAMP protein Csm4 [Thermovirga lienii]AER65978.1 CRISPR-associated protein, Csm4 family [Thermovirga lienii DSM 17291]